MEIKIGKTSVFWNETECFKKFVYLNETHTKIYNDVIIYNTEHLHSVNNWKLYYIANCSNSKQKCTTSDIIVVQ